MSSDLGYINARVRGLKSQLLGPEFYNDALNATDFRAFTSSFSQSPYMRDYEEAEARYEGLRAIDAALAGNFYRTTRSILTFSDGRAERLIAVVLLRYDLANLKAIARAKHAGREYEDMRDALLPAGRLKPAVLETIASAPDLPAAAQSLAFTQNPLAPAFSRAVREYSSSNDLYELELSLDRAYYRAVFDELEAANAPRDLVRYMQREVDATNLRTALKLRGQTPPDEAAEFFVPGGREVSRSTFESLLANDSPAALQELSSTSFSEVAETDSLSAADEAIRSTLDRDARRLALGDPLGIGVVLNYLRQKESEAARLRLLARGKYYGVPRPQLERELGNA